MTLTLTLANVEAAQIASIFIELGLAVLGLALLTRLAHRFAISAIPLYLLGGLAFGKGGLIPLHFSEEFVQVGAEIGVILLLFMLGLEYSGSDLRDNLRDNVPAGATDLLLNFLPGLAAGFLLGWSALAAVLLGGVTYISSSGIVARVLTELNRLNNRETPVVLAILVFEDLAMAVFPPVVAVLLVRPGLLEGIVSVAGALVTVTVVLVVAVRYGDTLSRYLAHPSDEVVLLTTFGIVLTVAGATQWLRVSAAVGAFLVGVALAKPLVKPTHRLLGPLRDLFAALFFLFFGLETDPGSLPAMLVPAIFLAAVTAATKLATGWWAARRAGLDSSARWRAGAALVARGEFSIVIAGLGVEIEPKLGPLAAAYVLILAVAGPILARAIAPQADSLGGQQPLDVPGND